jgi:hypothetical protein
VNHDDGRREPTTHPATTEHDTEILNKRQCLELLGSEHVGRLGVTVAARPEIFPVNYVLDATGAIIFQTAPGTKLEAALNHHVVFEVDHAPDRASGWSVIVHGVAHHTSANSLRFAGSPPSPWVAGASNTMRINPSSISGRRFTKSTIRH